MQAQTGDHQLLRPRLLHAPIPTLDGKFRRVKITLNGSLQRELDYRQGYFAGKEFGKFTAADKERQLEDALMLGDPITDLTIAMEINYFQLNRAEYFVPVTVKIPGSELALARSGGAERTLIDFIGEMKDDYGTTIRTCATKSTSSSADETASGARQAADSIRHRLHAAAGQVHDQVPRARRRDGPHRHLSGVVRDSQPEQGRQAHSDQLRRPEQPARATRRRALQRQQGQGAAAQAANPLVVEGQKLIPSVTRVFSKSRDMYVYLQAYERDATTHAAAGRLRDVLSRPDEGVRDARRCRSSKGWIPSRRRVPLRFSLSLSKLPPGEYNCQVTVLDPTSQKAAFWQAPVMLDSVGGFRNP